MRNLLSSDSPLVEIVACLGRVRRRPRRLPGSFFCLLVTSAQHIVRLDG